MATEILERVLLLEVLTEGNLTGLGNNTAQNLSVTAINRIPGNEV